jgi:hypothetical protein
MIFNRTHGVEKGLFDSQPIFPDGTGMMSGQIVFLHNNGVRS